MQKTMRMIDPKYRCLIHISSWCLLTERGYRYRPRQLHGGSLRRAGERLPQVQGTTRGHDCRYRGAYIGLAYFILGKRDILVLKVVIASWLLEALIGCVPPTPIIYFSFRASPRKMRDR